MDWILLDNKPLKKLTQQHNDIYKKLEEMDAKIDVLEKKNQNLENFLIRNQKLYLRHFNIICDILQENRILYMKQFQNESDGIESLKPILNDIRHRSPSPKDNDNGNEETLVARFNNLVWRATGKPNSRNQITTPKFNPVNLINNCPSSTLDNLEKPKATKNDLTKEESISSDDEISY